jgi:hypothetical protein
MELAAKLVRKHGAHEVHALAAHDDRKDGRGSSWRGGVVCGTAAEAAVVWVGCR